MAQQIINVGTAPNDGLGDPIRTAYIKCNDNFSELYSRWQTSPPITLVGTPGDSAGMYAYDSTYFYYCFGDYDGSTVIWNQISQSSNLVNGTSNISIYNNGNITTGVAGSSNVTVVTSTGFLVNGDLSVTGNATLSGNILADRIVNGTSELDIQVSGGNANLTIGGTSNVVVWSTAGQYVTGLVSVSGNVTGGNVTTAGLVSATGNVTGGNILTAGIMSSTGNATHGNILTAGIMSSTGNATHGNILTAGLITATGNIQAGNLRTAGLVTATGNVTGGNILTAGLITATGNVQAGNIRTAGLVSATGTIAGGNTTITGFANVSAGLISIGSYVGANISDGLILDYTTGNGRITVGSSDGLNIYNGPAVANTLIASFGTTGSLSLGTSGTANLTAGNVLVGSVVSATANVTGGNIRTAGVVSATANITGNNISSVTTMQLAVYANTTVRDSSIASPIPGMMIYVTGTGMQVRGATSWNTVAGTGT